MNLAYLLAAILVAALATFATRLIPFVFFTKRTPGRLLRHIEKNMPVAIMVVLVFYSLKDVKWSATYGLHELGSLAVAVVLHVWLKNALVSIILATVCYMVLIRFPY